MAEVLSFVPTRVEEISRSLGSMFDAPDSTGYVARASAGNVFIVGVPQSAVSSVSEFAASLATIHRARFFIVALDEHAGSLSAETASVQFQGGNGAHHDGGGLEIIRLRSPSQLRSAAISVLRANSIPGFASLLYVWEWGVDEATTLYMMSQVDSVICDSAAIASPWSFLDRTRNLDALFIDLNWIRLGVWRDQIRNAFDRPIVASMINQLSRVEIGCSGGIDNDPTILLLAGWILERLSLEPVALSSRGFECMGRSGASVTVRILMDKGDDSLTIHEVSFVTDDGRRSSHVQQNDFVRSEVSFGENYSFAQRIEDKDTLALLGRYFLVGESTKNYSGALEVARGLRDLALGYRR